MNPYLSIALTEQCNLNCVYCPPHGETYGTPRATLELDDALGILQVAHELGVNKVRLTGGEPLLYARIGEVLSYASSLGLETHLNTNGVLLHRYAGMLNEFRGLHVKVSLDTMKRELYREITGKDSLSHVIRGINSISEYGILKRLSTVVTTKNNMGIRSLLSFCEEKSIGIKIHDMYVVPERRPVWKNLYKSLEELRLEGEPGPRNEYSERYGIPTKELIVNGVNVRLKDSHFGTTYHPTCEACPHWPCQEGFYCLVITPSKHVVPCRLGGHLRQRFGNQLELSVAISEAMRIYRQSYRANLFWDTHAK